MKHQLGVKAEAAYGAPEVVDRFVGITSETLARSKNVVQSNALRARGRRSNRAAGRVVTSREAAGNVVWDVLPSGFGLWLEHTLGTVVTTQPDNVGAPTVFEHAFSVGDLWGKSLTVQKGVEREDRGVVPYTYVGCKVASLQLQVDARNLLVATVAIDAKDELDTEALAVASYPDDPPFHAGQMTLTLDAVAVASVRSKQLTLTNPMDTDRYFIGGNGTKGQQRENDGIEASGQIVADFVSKEALYDAYAADTGLALELSFLGANISGAFVRELKLSVPDIRLDGATPQISGPGLPQITVPWVGLEDAAANDVTALLRNTDAAA